jgi:hypothetical protein
MRDQHPWKVYMKGRQVGVSELAINDEIWFLSTHPNTKWIRTFPRDRQLEDFVRSRIDKALEETPRMRALVGSPNQAHAKRIGDSFLFIRSAWESNLGEGIDADGVTLDEKDRMRPGVEVAFKQSLSSSRYGYLREVSTPTIPGKGVHESFLRSDQREWFVRCKKCGLKQPIEYPDNVVQVKDIPVGAREIPEGSYEFLCNLQKCRGALDRMRGEWVAKRPEVQQVRGFHISQLIAPWLSATYVMRERQRIRSPQMFNNYILGLPAMGDNVLLTESDYEMACAGHPLMFTRTSDWIDVSVGIDWGDLNWVIVTARNVHNDREYVVGVNVFKDDPNEELRSVKSVDSYIAPFEPDIIVADAGYGKDRNAFLLRRYGEGRFYACFYNPAPRESRTFRPVWGGDDAARVLVDRTLALKTTCRALKEREIGLPDYDEHPAGLLKEHLKNLVPLVQEEEGKMWEEIAARGDDHLAHSLAYSMLGREKLTKDSRFNYSFV